MTCSGELMTLFLSVVLYGESPLEPIQILWINLVTGAMVSIPLSMEPGTGSEMNQPPRESGVGLLYPGMLLRLGFTALCMSIPVVWIFHQAPLPDQIDSIGAHEVRQTLAFSSIVVFEWLFAFHARSPEKGILVMGVFRNRWLIPSMVAGLSLQALVVYLPIANRIFHTRPLSGEEVAWVFVPALIVVMAEALRKKLALPIFSWGQWRLSRRPG